MLHRPETLGYSTLSNLPAEQTQPKVDSSAVFETAMSWAENVSRDFFQDTYQMDLLRLIEQRAQQYLSVGITVVCDASVTPKLENLLELAQYSNNLPIDLAMLKTGSSYIKLIFVKLKFT